jgi:hypothetical protein
MTRPSDTLTKIRACTSLRDLDDMVAGRKWAVDRGLAGWDPWTAEETQAIALRRAELARAGR